MDTSEKQKNEEKKKQEEKKKKKKRTVFIVQVNRIGPGSLENHFLLSCPKSESDNIIPSKLTY